MKFLVARLNHETNTFSPVRTPLAAFEPRHGEAALDEQRNARTAMGAFIRLLEARAGSELVTPLSATANPSGTVDGDAYEQLAASIVDALTDDIDAVLLDLHGAMVAEHVPDGEGELLRRLRERRPAVPIAVALDLHGNVTEAMVSHADIIVGFKTYPHIDMAETGEHAGRLLLDWLDGQCRPVLRWRQLPLLSHTLRSNTSEGAMQRAVDAARAMEKQPGVLAATVMAGFSLADFTDAGMSVLVVSDGDSALAEQVAGELADRIWHDRDGFVYRSEALAESLRRAGELAAQPGHGPVLLLDHSDNVMSGGSCDTMDVLVAALDAGLTGMAAGPLCDPAAVAQLWELPDGACADIELGNRWPLRAGDTRRPQRLRGHLVRRSDGRFTVSGPIYTGAQITMGRTVLFDTGAAQLVISEHRMEPYDIGVFACVGLDPGAARFLLLKSRMYCRPVFCPLSRGLVECDSDTGGPTSANYALFSFSRLRRPIYPLDDAGACSS